MKIILIGLMIVLMSVGISNAQTDLIYQPAKKVIDKSFLEVSAFLVASTIFDVETTFAAIHNGAHEANPLMKPFVNKGRVPTYAVQLGVDAILLSIAYEIKKSSHRDLQKVWWVLPTVAATGHTVASGLNLRYVW